MIRYRNFLPLVAAALVGASILAAPPQAQATLSLRFSTDGGATFNSLGSTAANPGVVSGPVASFSVAATTSAVTGSSFSLLDLAVSGLADPDTYNLVIQASVDGINTAPPPQGLDYFFTGSFLPAQLTATMRAWVDDNNVLFGTGNIVADTTSLGLGNSGSLTFTASDPYSATVEIRITGTNSQLVNVSLDNNIQVTPAPEPGTLVMALLGVPVLGFGAWRRRRRNRTTT